MMDIDRTQKLFQLILAIAGQADDFFHRSLRPIHLLKYAYLADLAFAKRNNGQIFTGIPWKFHHFGPWSTEAYQQIEPALAAVGATCRIIESKYDDDKDRQEWCWRGEDHELADLRKGMPSTLVCPLQQHIKQFGGYATYDLLHLVYSTEPIRKAAPGDLLMFPAETVVNLSQHIETVPISAKQRKLRRARIAEVKAVFQAKLAATAEKVSQSPHFTPPVYDEAFFEGVACFETMAADDIKEGNYIIEIDPAVWKSGSREEHDIP